jgi:tRNA (guanine-N7-)-methyltransferase
MTFPDTVPHDLPPSDDNTDDSAGDGDNKPHPLHRRLKSFVKRAGRTTDGQARAFSELGPLFLIPYTPEPLDLTAAFGGRAAPTVLEIGFGMGEATAHIAAVLPEKNFLCCEVHEPGVGALLKRIGEQGLTNIRICAHDAVEVLDHMLQPGTLAGVHIFFPDPWHKKRHNKRRLIQPEFVAKLRSGCAPAATSTAPPTGSPTPSRCSRCCRPEPLLRTRPKAMRRSRNTGR